jgi:broad specificity phosphatase PhoE
MARMRAFLDHVAGHAPVGPVLAVSHENPILAASALAGRQPLEAALDHLPNCGWIEIEWPRP